MMKNLIFHFPRSRFVDENGICGQVLFIYKKANRTTQKITNTDISEMATKVMEVYHEAETALRILEEKYGVNIQDLMHKVADKYDERSYYSEDQS